MMLLISILVWDYLTWPQSTLSVIRYIWFSPWKCGTCDVGQVVWAPTSIFFSPWGGCSDALPNSSLTGPMTLLAVGGGQSGLKRKKSCHMTDAILTHDLIDMVSFTSESSHTYMHICTFLLWKKTGCQFNLMLGITFVHRINQNWTGKISRRRKALRMI